MHTLLTSKSCNAALLVSLWVGSSCAPSNAAMGNGAATESTDSKAPREQEQATRAADKADQQVAPGDLQAPSVELFEFELPDPILESESGLSAIAYHFNALVRSSPKRSAAIIAYVRRGQKIPVKGEVQGSGCQGDWYQLPTVGYICESDGFNIGEDPDEPPKQFQTRLPRRDRNLPYDYFTVEPNDSPIYWRMPDSSDITKALDGRDAPALKAMAMPHHWMALDDVHTVGSHAVYRSVRGHYLHDHDVEPIQPSGFATAFFDGPDDLPLAIVREASEIEFNGSNSNMPKAMAMRYARFRIDEASKHATADASKVCAREGGCIERASVSFARLEPRPEGVSGDDLWIHIDLSEQVLVAYEGDRPRMATLVATGKGDWATPTGLFEISAKYVTKTMSADNDVDGHYFVDQVPWTMFYSGSLAIHGAYWHDEFGAVRSHGCVNVPPAPARFLFYWAKPELEPGFHGRLDIDGPKVWVTD